MPYLDKSKERSNILAPPLLAGDTITCAIMIDMSLYSKGYSLGYLYELFKAFEQQQGCTVNLLPHDKTPMSQWINLAAGTTDIIIINSQKDTVPNVYQDKVISSIPLNNNEDVCVVNKNNYRIIQTLNYWLTFFKQTPEYKKITPKYYHRVKQGISPYDNYIKKYAPLLNWDWRLLASLIYQESKFKVGVSSSMGAIGLMQIKESIANKYGIDDIYNPESNIKAGVFHLQRLQNLYRKMGADSINTIKLSLAAYNAGEGRLDDCMNVAALHGKNPLIWQDIVEIIPLMREKDFHVVKFGKFSGKETLSFVDNIINRYDKYSLSVAK
ncbi:MAG: transglycosylase SLT domain-containing protein [Bacteroidales bacterium]